MSDEELKVSGSQLLGIGIAVLALIASIFAVGTSLAANSGGSASGGAAGGGGDGPVAAQPIEVAVTVNEYSIVADTTTMPQGSTLLVRNDGSIAHNLQIKGTDLITADLNNGQEGSLDISQLPPGEYEWICAIAGHEASGMHGTFTITDGAVVAGPGDDASDDASEGHDDHGSGDGELSMADMEGLMEASLKAFPTETEGRGGQVLEPTIMDDGTLLFELTVDEIEWEVEPDVFVSAMAYNGQIPGPILKADIGDRVIVRVTNELDDQGTSVHPHGVRDHLFEMDGVSYISQDPIASGETFDYVFDASRPSVGMYHSHHMSLHQVVNGLAGAFIIGDYAEMAGVEGVVDEMVMVTNDAGELGFTMNGKSFPATEAYSYQVGDRVIVHYFNEGLMSHPMHLHNQDGLVIAKDGYLLPQPYYMDTINVAPGERYTVVYEMEHPGTWLWHCHILSHIERPDGTHFGMVAGVIITE